MREVEVTNVILRVYWEVRITFKVQSRRSSVWCFVIESINGMYTTHCKEAFLPPHVYIYLLNYCILI